MTVKSSIPITALGVAAALALSMAPVRPAEASSAGRRNTAIGLGALAVYGVATKKPLIAGLAGGGAIYSYMRSREHRHRRGYRSRRYRRVYYRRHYR